LAISAAAAPALAATPVASVRAQQIPDVPRNRTLIMAGLGGEHYGGFTDLGNYNSFSPTISRSGWTQAATEGLFYYNMLGDDFIPWLATDYQYNADDTQLTVHIRPGAEWADGQPFTAKDVAFTLMLLKGHPDLNNGAEVNRLVSAPCPRMILRSWAYGSKRCGSGCPRCRTSRSSKRSSRCP